MSGAPCTIDAKVADAKTMYVPVSHVDGKVKPNVAITRESVVEDPDARTLPDGVWISKITVAPGIMTSLPIDAHNFPVTRTLLPQTYDVLSTLTTKLWGGSEITWNAPCPYTGPPQALYETRTV